VKTIKLAIAVDSLPPYRIHQHRVIAEIRGVHLSTIRLEESTQDRWKILVPEIINPIDYTKQKVTGLQGIVNGLKIVNWLREQKIDLVIVNGYAKAAYVSLIIGCYFTGIYCCVFGDSNIHCNKLSCIKAIAKKIVLSTLFKMVRMCLPCGLAGMQYLLTYGVKKEKISYFPYEPDCELIINLSDEYISEVSSRYLLPTERKRIVFCGRLISAKRPDIVIKCFSEIADKYFDWDLVIIGDGPLRYILESMVPAELKSRVRFLGFLGEQLEVSAIYRCSDILFHPADFEPWGLIIHEAIVAKMAVISSTVVGAAIDLIIDGENGYKCPPGNVQEFVIALEKVIFDLDSYKNASSKILNEWMAYNGSVPALKRILSNAGMSINGNFTKSPAI
jgi:glycosyltransferase involved in cell wall biosynthesis